MADKIFTIPLLNGIRFTNQNIDLDARYNSRPFDNEIDQQSYAQQWQSGGVLRGDGTEVEGDIAVPVVLLSDYPDMTLKFYKSNTKELITTVALNATATALLDVTFLQYAAFVDFSSFPKGWCFGLITYTDDAEVLQSWISCPLNIAPYWPLTMLYEYAHSYNKNDVLFTPGNLILQMRVEANMIGGYTPKSQRETFEDQTYNPTLLNGIPFRTFTNYILGTGGPDWVVDKLNLVFTCDQVRIDGTFYVATNGTDFKATRPNNQLNRDGMWELDVQSVPGFEFGQLTAGTTPTGDLVVIRKIWPLPPFANVSASFAVNGVFTVNSTLDYLQVFNYGADTFILKLGTTVGDDYIANLEIGTPNADLSIDLISTHDIGHGFNVPTTVYVTIPGGVNLKVLFIYDQLDAPSLNPVVPVGNGLPQGTLAFYRELVPGYFDRDWDISTGLGQVGSLYEGCQIEDMLAGKYVQVWNRFNNDISNPQGARGQEVGNLNNEVSITQAYLPAVGLNMFTNEINLTAGDLPDSTDPVARARSVSGQPLNYEIVKGTVAPTLGVTAPMGAGGDLDITPDSLIYLAYIKL